MKPILFIDVDGVLNWFPPDIDAAIPWRKERDAFLDWARERFECRFLTAWFESVWNVLPARFHFPVEQWVHDKTEAIRRLAPNEAWFWLDDDRMQDEQRELQKLNATHRFIHINNRKADELLRARTVLEKLLTAKAQAQ